MSLTPDEAAKSLREATETEMRSREAYGYSLSAPHLFMWGAVWMVGYSATAFLPQAISGWIWLSLIAGAIVGGFVITRSQHGKKPSAKTASISRRIGGTIGIIYAFTAALYLVVRPTWNLHDAASYWALSKMVAAYWPLLFSAIYGAVGLWVGARYSILGAFIATATLGGFFLLSGQHFLVWMAVVGGGALFLTGFWMQKA